METPELIPPQWPRVVAIIGGGTMGLGVAECLAAAGLPVRLVDATPEISRQAYERLMERVRAHVAAGLLQPGVVERAAAVQAVGDITAAVENVDLVFEAVPEQLDLKRDILAAISAAVPPEAVIATNTSSLPVDELAASVVHPGRFLGMHWFNPP